MSTELAGAHRAVMDPAGRAAVLLFGTVNEQAQSLLDGAQAEDFWSRVCDRSRWIVPAERMMIVMRGAAGDWRVVARRQKGAMGEARRGDPLASPRLARAVGGRLTRWMSRHDEPDSGPTSWLLSAEADSLLVAPMLRHGGSRGALVFACGAVEPRERRMLQSAATTFALLVCAIYSAKTVA